MRIVLFEDDKVRQLDPITLLRPAYTIRCGGERLLDWALNAGSCVRGLVRPHLQGWQEAECPTFCGDNGGRDRTLLVNARIAPSQHNFDALNQLLVRRLETHVIQDGSLIAAVLPPEFDISSEAIDSLATLVPQHSPPHCQVAPITFVLLDHPHHLIQNHLDSIQASLNRKAESGLYREIREGVFAEDELELNGCVHTDTSQGPIVIDEGVTIRPFSCLYGPVYLARCSCVNEHAVLRNGVAVGAHAKVGGEISASVIGDFSNKQHYGFLGHSYLGEWVNLGAGTCNSNLKNTYGTIRLNSAGQKIDTGLQFLGCVVGDYTKSAINTAIFTGKLIGVCSMLYGYVTTNVPSYVNYARSFGQMTDMNPAVAAETQRRVFSRRGIQQQPWQVELLHNVYRQIAAGRQLADEPVSL